MNDSSNPPVSRREQAGSRYDLSVLLKNRREWAASLDAIDRALAVAPTNAPYCAHRVDLLIKLDRVEDAMAYLATLPASVGKDPAMGHVRVALLELDGSFDAARDVLEESVAHTLHLQQFDFAVINQWLTAGISSSNNWLEFPARLQRLAAINKEDRRYQGLIAAYAMIYAWLGGSLVDVLRIADEHRDFEDFPDIDEDRAMRVFYRFIRQLALFPRPTGPAPDSTAHPVLNVLGESHCLSPGNTLFQWQGAIHHAKSRFIMGIQMRHLGQAGDNTYKRNLRSHLASLPDGPLLLTIGEIDCRPVEGIWRAAKRRNQPASELVASTVEGYLSFLGEALSHRPWSSITLQGVPAPGYDLTDRRDPGDKQGFIDMIKSVNRLLCTGAQARGWHFLDIHSATANSDGLGNGLWHLDDRYHLKPSFYVQAMKWCIAPEGSRTL